MQELFIKYTLTEIKNPQKEGILRVIKDHYWITDAHYVFVRKNGSPQCNSNINIIKQQLTNSELWKKDNITYVFIPWAYLPYE